MKVSVNFRQRRFHGNGVSKEIDLLVPPQIGGYFQYQDGWALERVETVSVGSDWVEIDYYGPQFTDEELTSLEAAGWEVRR